MAAKVIYFTVGGQPEQAEFRSDDTPENVRAMFHAAAEAQDGDILKLYNVRGSMINISPTLPANTPETRYKLEVVAANTSGISASFQHGIDIDDLTSRIHQLEAKLSSHTAETPGAIQKLRAELDMLKEKLESFHHLSWLGLYKDMSSSTLAQSMAWTRLDHESKSTDRLKQICDKVEQLSQVLVSDETKEYLRKPTFDNWQWDEAEMIILLRQMFIDLGLLSKCNIEMEVLVRWLLVIYQSYNDVPFHNFKHCFMVSQMMYGLIWMTDLQSQLDGYDVLILIVSAICHDLDHPGYNNAYQINARTELALRYNDISPLENHHCFVAFEILERKNVNILAHLDADTYRRVREGIIKCILATDMANHHTIVETFRRMLPTFDITAKDQKEQLMMILIKVADISNEMRPMGVADLWLECLLQEYFKQSDLEKLEGLPVAPFMDRDKVSKPSSQIGFIKFILLPLIESLTELFPSLTSELVDPVQHALAYYKKMQDDLENEKLYQTENSMASMSEMPADSPCSSSDDVLGHADHKFKVKKISQQPALK